MSKLSDLAENTAFGNFARGYWAIFFYLVAFMIGFGLGQLILPG